MELIRNKLLIGVAGLVFAIVLVFVGFKIFSKEEAEPIDVSKYELPSVVQEYLKENPKLKNGYISGTKIYTATEQMIKRDTVYTYYVLHLILPDEGKFYDIEDKKGLVVDYYEGDSESYVYDTEETYETQVIQVIKDKKGNYTINTY